MPYQEVSDRRVDMPTARNEVKNPAMSSSFNLFSKYVFLCAVTLIVFGCSIVAAIVALPLLLACFIATRFFQFVFGCGHAYDKSRALKVVIKLKFVLRTWIYIDSAYIACLLLAFYAVIKFFPRLGLHDEPVLGYPISRWIKTYFIVFGISSMSYIVSIFVIRFVILNIPLKYHTFQSGSHVVSDTVSEIIDSFIFLLLTWHEVLIYHPTLKQYQILKFYPIYKLFYVLIYLFVLHNLVKLSIHVIVWQLHNMVVDPGNKSIRQKIATMLWGRESIVFWANGTKSCIIVTFNSLILLFVWVFYFGRKFDDRRRPDIAKKVLSFGTRTCLSLFFFSFLWLIKTSILLLLEIRTVYNKFGPKISEGGNELYFLGIIGRHQHDIFKLQYDGKRKPSSQTPKHTGRLAKIKNACGLEIIEQELRKLFTGKGGVKLLMLSLFPVLLIKDMTRYHSSNDPEDIKWGKSKQEQSDPHYVKKLSTERKKRAREDLLTQEEDSNATRYHSSNDPEDSKREKSEQKPSDPRSVKKLSIERRKRVREDLLTQEEDSNATLYELQKMAHYFLEAKHHLSQDDYTSKIMQYIKNQADDIDNRSIEEITKRLINKADGNGHKKDGEDWNAFKKNRHEGEDLEAWMERARNNCVFLANILSSAKELVECFDNFMSLLIVVVCFIGWLLFTELASTKAFVVIGSPILALSFIFGDALKTFFQGIVFVYVVHPFDVGDLCVIDEKMLEVIKVGIWKTTFSKVDTLEEVVYPNSDLVNKDIINHRTEFDWNDYVELYVGSRDIGEANKLKRIIERSLKDGKYESIRGGLDVTTTVDNNIKIGVNLRYNTSPQKKSKTYFECFREKSKLRSQFVQSVVGMDYQDATIEGDEQDAAIEGDQQDVAIEVDCS